MKTAFFIILALLALAALGRWMLLMLIDGLSGIAGEHEDDVRTEGPTSEERKNARIAAELDARRDKQLTREIEQWRDGE